MNRIALFPGSFDPFTLGHYNIVVKSLKLFDLIIIGIGKNSSKARYFEVVELIPKIQKAFEFNKEVSVIAYEGLTSEFAKSMGAQFLIRGVRSTTDFEYEKGIAEANKFLVKNLETVFMLPDPEIAFISSSIVREIHKNQRDINALLPYKM